MRASSRLTVLIVLAAALACLSVARAEQGHRAPKWERQLTFAKLLGARGYHDFSDLVIRRLLGDKSIKETHPDKAQLHKELGYYYADLAVQAATGSDAMEKFTDYLGRSVTYFEKYLDHPSIKNRTTLAEERFEIRIKIIWIRMKQAEGYAIIWADPETTKAQKEVYKKKVTDIYKTALKEFEDAVGEKRKEQDKVKAQAPQDKQKRAEWTKRYNAVREAHVRVRLYLNSARVDLAKFLKKSGATVNVWQPYVERAAGDYKQMLLDFIGAQGIVQVNVPFAEALVMLGTRRDKDALERLEDVWQAREMFRSNRAVPCRARHITGSIFARQKKYKEALDALDEMLVARTRKAWDPDAINAEAVTRILLEIEGGDDASQYDRKALAKTFLLEADIYADLAKQAEDARKPRQQVRALYAIAYNIAVGVGDANLPLDVKYGTLLERWRTKAKLPPSLTVLRKRAESALRKKEYGEAARLYTEILAASKFDPSTMRTLWDTIGRCYYMNKEYYRAYVVFSAMARWHPEPAASAHANALSAAGAVDKQAKATKLPFDVALVERAKRDAEGYSPLGPGARTIEEATEFRKAGRLADALRVLGTIRPTSVAYPHALYQIALTRKTMYLKLPADERKRAPGQAALKAMVAAFDKLIAFYKTRAPQLKEEGETDRLQRLVDVTAAGLAVLCDAYLQPYLNQPARVLELTGGLKRTYPGIETAYTFPVLYFNRMRAAYVLVRDGTVAQADTYLPIVEECWKIVQGFDQFRYIDKVCGMGADAYNRTAKKLDEEIKKATGAAAKAALEKRAAAARDRGLEFYIELIQVAPRQSVRTYRYILYQLENRPHEPKSADYRLITEIAPKVVALFAKDRGAAEQVEHIKTTLGITYCRLEKYRDAMPLLEDVDKSLDSVYQRRMATYEKLKARHEKNPKRYEKPKLPMRRALHLEVRKWLARSYLESAARTKYKVAERIYSEDLRIYQRNVPEYWDILYWLCETYRREGLYEEILKQIDRAIITTAKQMGNRVVKEGKGTSRDFRDLLLRMRRDVGRITDATRRARLSPLVERVLGQLSK